MYNRTYLATLCAVIAMFAVGELASADTQTTGAVSLVDLLSAGAKSHPSRAQRSLLTRSLELTKEKADRAYWPQLEANGTATWQSDVTSVAIPLPGVDISPPPKEQYRATLELRQQLWDGGIRAAKKRIAAGRVEVDVNKAELAWYQVREQIIGLYFAGVVQQERRRRAEALAGYLGKTLSSAQAALANGVVTERDVILVQTRQLEATQAIADADANLASVKQSLSQLTGASVSATQILDSPVLQCSSVQNEPAAAGLPNRPDLALLAAQESLLSESNRLQRSVDRPKLGAFATAGYGRPGLNFLNENPDAYFIGGVSLNVPLTYLYAGTHRNDREQLSVQRSLVSRQRDAVVLGIRVQLDTKTAEVGRLDGAIARDEELLALRMRARQQTELQLSLGTATMADLVGDLSEEDVARGRGSLHRIQRDLACHELAYIKGEL